MVSAAWCMLTDQGRIAGRLPEAAHKYGFVEAIRREMCLRRHTPQRLASRSPYILKVVLVVLVLHVDRRLWTMSTRVRPIEASEGKVSVLQCWVRRVE